MFFRKVFTLLSIITLCRTVWAAPNDYHLQTKDIDNLLGSFLRIWKEYIWCQYVVVHELTGVLPSYSHISVNREICVWTGFRPEHAIDSTTREKLTEVLGVYGEDWNDFAVFGWSSVHIIALIQTFRQHPTGSNLDELRTASRRYAIVIAKLITKVESDKAKMLMNNSQITRTAFQRMKGSLEGILDFFHTKSDSVSMQHLQHFLEYQLHRKRFSPEEGALKNVLNMLVALKQFGGLTGAIQSIVNSKTVYHYYVLYEQLKHIWWNFMKCQFDILLALTVTEEDGVYLLDEHFNRVCGWTRISEMEIQGLDKAMLKNVLELGWFQHLAGYIQGQGQAKLSQIFVAIRNRLENYLYKYYKFDLIEDYERYEARSENFKTDLHWIQAGIAKIKAEKLKAKLKTTPESSSFKTSLQILGKSLELVHDFFKVDVKPNPLKKPLGIISGFFQNEDKTHQSQNALQELSVIIEQIVESEKKAEYDVEKILILEDTIAGLDELQKLGGLTKFTDGVVQLKKAQMEEPSKVRGT